MIKKSYFWTLQVTMMAVMFGTGFSSCDGDDQEAHLDSPTEIKVNSNGHNYVDIGLSVYWASSNIGAYSSTDQGNKYAFGETTSKSEYTSTNYIGGNADVVKQLWGGDWRLPTSSELEDLVTKCSWKIRTVNGVQVVTATGPNGNSIDLPFYSYLGQEGYQGWYWSSSSSTSSKAYCLHFSSANGAISTGTNYKYNGFLVRGVITNPNYTASGDGNGGGNGNNSGGGESTESLYFTNFNYTATQTSVTVKFYTNERASNATIKYGKNSASSSVSTTITNKEISATIKGLTKGTKYYVKCTARNSNESITSEEYPVITNY